MTDDTYLHMLEATTTAGVCINDAIVGSGRDNEETAYGLIMDAVMVLAPFLSRSEMMYIAENTKFRDEQ